MSDTAPQIGDKLTALTDIRRDMFEVGEDAQLPEKVKICAVVDGPNADSTLGRILGRGPELDDRPDHNVLYRWIVGDALGRGEPIERLQDFAYKVDVKACFFLNASTGTLQPITAFANYLAGNTFWDSGVKYTGNQVRYDQRDPDDERYDIDPDMLDYIDKHTPEDPANSYFYIMSNDFRNIADKAIELASEGHVVTIVCYSDLVVTGRVRDAGVRIVDYRDIEGIFKPGHIPPRLVNLEAMKPGDIRYFPSIYRHKMLNPT